MKSNFFFTFVLFVLIFLKFFIKSNFRLIEEAETRRLEEQLKMLKLSKENEILKQNEIVSKVNK